MILILTGNNNKNYINTSDKNVGYIFNLHIHEF